MGPVEQALWAACVTLARDRGLERVRVADICRHAWVHRSTFYRHFEDKRDLVERGTARLVLELAGEVQAPHEAAEALREGLTPRHLVRLFEVARVRREQLSVVLDPVRGFAFRTAMQAALADLGLQRLHELAVDGDVPAQLVARFSAAGIVEALEWWIGQGCEPDPEAVAQWLGAFLARGMLAPLGVPTSP